MPHANLTAKREYMMAYEARRKGTRTEYMRQYREKNREIIRAKKHEYYVRNIDERRAANRAYCKNNKTAIRARRGSKYTLAWQRRHRAKGNCILCGKPADGFVRCAKHRQWFREYARKRRSLHLESERAKDRAKAAKRLLNPSQKLAYKIRSRLRYSLRRCRVGKTHSGLTLLGCSIADFRIYIESKFEVGMDWGNWGYGRDKWNLDHIIPVALFDLTKLSHQRRCFHFSNYQPLWQPDNLLKGIKCAKSHQFEML